MTGLGTFLFFLGTKGGAQKEGVLSLYYMKNYDINRVTSSQLLSICNPPSRPSVLSKLQNTVSSAVHLQNGRVFP